MSTKLQPVWDVRLMADDMAVKGWHVADMARASGLSYKTVQRFLDGTVQTAKTAGKLAAALGRTTTRRYLRRVA
jgi:plasmid maintenance system antidote protein VapI